MSDSIHYLISSQLHAAHERLMSAAEKLGVALSSEPNKRVALLFKAALREREEAPEKPPTTMLVFTGFSAILYAGNALEKEQYESALFWICGVNRIIGSLEWSREIAGEIEGHTDTSKVMSMLSKLALDERHRENRDMKAQALEHYAASQSSYSSKDEAAQAITRLVPVSFATARKWLKGQ